MTTHGQVRVEVRPVTAPDNSRRVLLQLPHGFVLLLPVDAIALGQMLIVTGGETGGDDGPDDGPP